jgi:hypothetical protein
MARRAGRSSLGHFARTGSVLGHPGRAEPPPAHFDPAGPSLGDSADSGSLLVYLGRGGPFSALEWEGRVLEHFAKPVLVHLARTAQSRFVRVHLPWPTNLEIVSTRLQVVPP